MGDINYSRARVANHVAPAPNPLQRFMEPAYINLCTGRSRMGCTQSRAARAGAVGAGAEKNQRGQNVNSPPAVCFPNR